jgi:uncharacterized membrane protein YgaE (UPF0421/DUF939 family)
MLLHTLMNTDQKQEQEQREQEYTTYTLLTEQCRIIRKKYIEKAYMNPVYNEKYQKYSQKLLCWVKRYDIEK